jgi:hypothetical protein
MKKIVISVTGHRLLTEQQQAKIRPIVKRAIENIIFTLGVKDSSAGFMAISPLAEGADTLFADIALELGLPLKVMLPFEKDEYLKDFSSDKVRQEFHKRYDAVANADRRTVGTVKEKDVNQLYLDMGKQLVDETDYLIAIWNEKGGRGKGGTADIVAYASEKQKNILIINPEDEQPHINYLHEENYKQNTGEVIDAPNTNHLTLFIARRQTDYDANAVLYNRKYKRLWTLGFVIGLVEVLAFSVIVSFHVSLALHFLLASVEFLCILSIIMLVVFGPSKRWHSKYVHYRIVSERLRIKKFFAELGLRIYHVTVSPIYFSLSAKPEYNILDNTIRLINLSAYSHIPFEARKKRLETELLTDQYKYHERKREKFEKKNDLYKNVRKFLFLVFVSAVVLHFAHVCNEFFLHHGVSITSWEPGLFHSELVEELVLFCSIFIPATIAACEALKYLYEWEKIITLSSSMARYFREESKRLAHIQNEEELEVFLNDINKDMLIENLDWEKYMHDKNEMPT